MNTSSDTFEYFHTHESVRDASLAMCKSQTWDTITLINEDGDIWTDPMSQWARLENIEYPDSYYEEEEEPVEDFTDIDYPEYDAQTAFFESEGRPMFPNEY